MENSKLKKILIITSIAIFMIIFISFLFLYFRPNPYGEEIKIDNFYQINLPQDKKYQITHQLYLVVKDNLSEGVTIPHNGAMVREGSHTQKLNHQVGKFLVDIASIKQSYAVHYDLRPSGERSGYIVVVDCPNPDELIYDNQHCRTPLTMDPFVSWENFYQLEYTFGFGASAKIRYILDQFILEKWQTSAHPDIPAVVDEGSLRSANLSPDIAYHFNFSIQNTLIQALVRMDMSYGKQYIAIYFYSNDFKNAIIISEHPPAEIVQWLGTVSGLSEVKTLQNSVLEQTLKGEPTP